MPTYFVLQPGSWPDAAAHLCRPLIGPRQGHEPKVPWVSVARSSAYGQFELIRRDGLDGRTARALVAEAQAWIDANQRTWQVVAKSGFLFWKKPSMVRPINASSSMGLTANPMDDLSSEQILSSRALLEAVGQLGSGDLIAVVPKRGWLVLTRGRAGELPRMMEAHQLTSGIFGRAGADALTDAAFFVQGGRPVGISVMEPKGGYVSLKQADEDEWLFPV